MTILDFMDAHPILTFLLFWLLCWCLVSMASVLRRGGRCDD